MINATSDKIIIILECKLTNESSFFQRYKINPYTKPNGNHWKIARIYPIITKIKLVLSSAIFLPPKHLIPII